MVVNPKIGAFFGAAAAALLVYGLSLPPGLTLVDAGVFSLAAQNLGVAPTTGYPLYTLLGRLWCRAFQLLGREPAWAMNLLSAASAAVAVGLFTLLAAQLARLARPEGPSGSEWPAALAAAALLALSYTFWSRALQAKMYALHWALWCALLLLALRLRYAKVEEGNRNARLLALALGLSAANHGQTALLLAPLLLLLFWGSRPSLARESWLRGLHWQALFLLAGLSLYLYLPLRSAFDPLPDWGRPRDWGSLWRHVSGWHLREHVGQGAAWGSMLLHGMKHWQNQYGLVLGALAALAAAAGALKLWARARAVAAALVLAGLIQAAFSLKFNNSEVDAYYVPLYMLLLLGAAMGLDAATATWSRRGAYLLALGMFLLGLGLNWGRSHRGKERLAQSFVEDVFAGLRQNTVLFTGSWDLVSGAYYLQARGLRPDLSVIDSNLLYSTWYYHEVKRRFPGLVPAGEAVEGRYLEMVARMAQGRLPASDTAGRAAMRQAACDLIRAMAARARSQALPLAGLFPDSLAQGRLEPEDLAVLGEAYRPAGLCLEPAEGPAGNQAPPDWDLAALLDSSPMDEPAFNMAKNYVRGLRHAAQQSALLGRARESAGLQARSELLRASISAKFERATRRW